MKRFVTRFIHSIMFEIMCCSAFLSCSVHVLPIMSMEKDSCEAMLSDIFENIVKECSKKASGNLICYKSKDNKYTVLRSGAFVSDDVKKIIDDKMKGMDCVYLDPFYVILLCSEYAQIKKHNGKQILKVNPYKTLVLAKTFKALIKLCTSGTSDMSALEIKLVADNFLQAFEIYLENLSKVLFDKKSKIKQAKDSRIAVPDKFLDTSFEKASVLNLNDNLESLKKLLKSLREIGAGSGYDLVIRLIRSLCFGVTGTGDDILKRALLKLTAFDLDRIETLLNLMRRSLHTEAQLEVLMQKCTEYAPSENTKILSMLNPCDSCQRLPIVIDACKTGNFYFFRADNNLEKLTQRTIQSDYKKICETIGLSECILPASEEIKKRIWKGWAQEKRQVLANTLKESFATTDKGKLEGSLLEDFLTEKSRNDIDNLGSWDDITNKFLNEWLEDLKFYAKIYVKNLPLEKINVGILKDLLIRNLEAGEEVISNDKLHFLKPVDYIMQSYHCSDDINTLLLYINDNPSESKKLKAIISLLIRIAYTLAK